MKRSLASSTLHLPTGEKQEILQERNKSIISISFGLSVYITLWGIHVVQLVCAYIYIINHTMMLIK